MGDSRENVIKETLVDPEALCRKVEDIPLGRSSACYQNRRTLTRQDTIDMFTEQAGEFLKEILMRDGEKVCGRCDSTILLEEVDDEDEEEEQEEIVDEDSVDGQPRCLKVIIKCECHHALPFIQKNKGTYVLQGTCIMQRYVNHTRYGTERPRREHRARAILTGCLNPRTVTEDITDHHQATTDLTITNPNATGTRRTINIGAKVTSLWDENGHIRHFIGDVNIGSPASNMELRVEDEILLLNDKLLVDVRAKDLKEIFDEVHTDEEFIMLTRRITNRRSALDVDKPEDVTYEYWQIKATITVDDDEEPILAERATVTQAHLRNGDLIVVADANVFPAYIKVDSGYFKNEGGLLEIHRNLNSNDASFKFDLLSYDGYVLKGARLVKQKIHLIRFSNSDGSKSFVYVGKSGNVKLKKAPSMFNEPSKNNINKDQSEQNFSIRKAVFLSQPASSAGHLYYLETYTRKDLYLQYDTGIGMLNLERVAEEYQLRYMRNVKFEFISSR